METHTAGKGREAPAPGAGHNAISPHSETGLGIDAGGTFTDAVVYNYASGAIEATAKALTTPWRYTEGIHNALAQIPPQHLRKVDLVSVSTTLATNALVENRGQKVGLLLMPPYGRFDEADLRHNPVAVVKGYMEMTGEIIEPVDPGQVEAAAQEMIQQHAVAAFAVSGVGATINASQELEVMEILRRTTSLSVTCGHQLSGKLGIYDRAVTAIYNAQVIPYIEGFLDELQRLLEDRHIDAPVMVVKGDGALMSVGMAKERPVETIFSGPAASVAGARKLTGLTDALVVDIGGTTTDVAAIRANRVDTCARGSVVAGRRTHVEALDMRTKGLGGDSAISLQNRQILIGPNRVTPIAFLASQWPQTSQALGFIARDLDPYRANTRTMRLLALNGHSAERPLDPVERTILDMLRERPYSIEEISQALDMPFDGFAICARLVRENIVSVSALTPTDVLHAEQRVDLWDAQAAKWMSSLYGSILRQSYEEFAQSVLQTITRELALELFEKLIEEDVTAPSPLGQAMLAKWLAPTEEGLAINMKLSYPVIGVGAPAKELLPEVVRLFHTALETPEHYEVANAIGAITSTVSISKASRVVLKDNGRYAIEGLADSREFREYETALDGAKAQVLAEVRRLAGKAGLVNVEVETEVYDDTVRDNFGGEVFLGTVVTAYVDSQGAASDR